MTVAAIAWGTLSIVLLLSFGEGLKRNFSRGSKGLGEGIVVVWPGATAKAFAGFPQGRNLPVRRGGRRRCCAPTSRRSRRAIARDAPLGQQRHLRPQDADQAGGRRLSPIYGELRNQIPQAGRPLPRRARRGARSAASPSSATRLKDELFGDGDAIGETHLINKTPFTVVGVMKKKIQMGTYSGPDDNNVVIPFSTFRALFGRRHLVEHRGQGDGAGASPRRSRTQLYEVLGGKYRFDPDGRARALRCGTRSRRQKITINIGRRHRDLPRRDRRPDAAHRRRRRGQHHVRRGQASHARRSACRWRSARGARTSSGRWSSSRCRSPRWAARSASRAASAWSQLLAFVQSKANSEALQFLGAPTFSFGVAAHHRPPARLDRFPRRLLSLAARGAIQPAVALRYE